MKEYVNNTIWNRIFRPNWNHEDVDSDTEWSHVVEGDTLRLSFQGSMSKLDWLQNFMVWRVPYRNMERKFRVHAGFLKKVKAIREDVYFLTADPEITKIETYGFSQGAPIAILMAEIIKYHYPPKDVSAIVYGCPRFISVFGAKEFERRIDITRVEYGNDIVTKIPPWLLLYKHVGKCIHIGEKRKWWKFSIKQHCESQYKE